MNSLERRRFVQSAGGLAASAALPWSTLSLAAPGGPSSRRLILVVLRGGMDGLAAAPVVGDPAYAEARGPLADFGAPVLPLSGPFALHPHLSQLHAMFGQGEALVVHATGLPYRERSHFDAQQVLESGGTQPHQLTTGWLARALGASGQRGIAITTAIPLVLRGPADPDTWAPSVLPEPSPDLVTRLERLYVGDPALSQALARAKGLRASAGMPMATDMQAVQAGGRNALVALARKAAEFVAQPDGPQAAVLDMNGWDSHANQTAANGAFANNLRSLDAALMAMRESLTRPETGGAWARTAIAVVTEFGREVAVNGTLGTDHGSGGVAFVLGGAVHGGRVIADWPGLAPRQRFEGRDLRATTDLRALFRGLLADHLGVARAALDREVFPGSAALRPLELLRA